MTLEQQLILSYYKEISVLNEDHKIYLVQHITTKQIYVKKILDVFNLNIYTYLKDNPVYGLPIVYEIIKDEDQLIIIEEYIPGKTLETILLENGPLPSDIVINYSIQLCDILSALHNKKPAIIHRDIKPTNIIITPDDKVILLDLNAAKYMNNAENEDTVLLGTKGYAAPEQYGFGASSTQTDIYALGILINTMLFGEYSIQKHEGVFNTIINKSTELNAQNRYESVSTLKDAILSVHNKSSYITENHLNSQAERTQILNTYTTLKSKYEKNNSYKFYHIRQFFPPGFRTGNVIHMLIAVLGYFIIFWLSSGATIKDGNEISLFVTKLMFFLTFVAMVFCSCNYLDIHSHIPLCKSENKTIKIIGIILLNVAVFFYMLLMMIFIVSFTNRL